MKTENNLEAILKSFDAKKIEEEKRKGIISIQEKKFIYGKDENVRPNIQNNLNITSNQNLRAATSNSSNYQSNQNQSFAKSNFDQNRNQNFQRAHTDKNISNSLENQANKIHSSNDSELNEFCLLNNLDDILDQYCQNEILESDPKPEQNQNSNNYQKTEIKQKNNFDHIPKKDFTNQIQNSNNFQERNKNTNTYSKINDNYQNHFNDNSNKWNQNNYSNNQNNYPQNNNNNNSTFSNNYNRSNEYTEETNKLSSLVEENLEADELQNFINEYKFEDIDLENNFDNRNVNIRKESFNNNLNSSNFNNKNSSNNFYGNNINASNMVPNKRDAPHSIIISKNSNINYENPNNFGNNLNKFNDNIVSDNIDSNNMGISNGNFIEKYCTNHQLANLSEWRRNFEWDDLIENANLRIFGFKTFRPNQREIINASLAGRDIFVCMPTGGGKSLTFQIPALVCEGVTIVVMPLISLIMDQVSFMIGLGVKVIFLNKDGENEIYQNFDELFYNEDPHERCKLLFLTPEKIAQSFKAKALLKRLYDAHIIDRFVIDEAHCLSQWGREFRPDYLNLKILRKDFPEVPLLAITATAPNKIREDIITQLQMRDALFFRSSYNRNNLYIEIRNKKDMSDVVSNMANFIKKKYPESSGLVYCASRKECETISEKLKRDHNLSASYYHASMPEKQKNSVQEKWKNDEIKIIVATIAFGMGINKADVRFVMHHAMPKSFENYYQEIGRAGRDGKKSHCIMYYNPADRRTLEYLMSNSQMNQQMITQNLRKITEIIDYSEEYCECRRVIALLYFDEKFDRNDCQNMCDNCRKNLLKEELDVTDDCIKILKFLNSCYRINTDMTSNQTIDYLRGLKRDKNKNKKMPAGDDNYGIFKSTSQDNLKKILRRLIISKYVEEKLLKMGEHTFSTMSISLEGIDYLKKFSRNSNRIIITFPKLQSGNNFEVDTGKNDENNKNKSGVKNNKFISKNVEKDINDYNYNIKDDLNLNDLEVQKKTKERKYARTKNAEKEIKEEIEKNEPENVDKKQRKNKNVNNEEDYGFCLQEQFEELLEKLKNKRREILRDENKKIELKNAAHVQDSNDNNIKKLSPEEIFPLTGLKELCRKLPSTEKELNSNYIFGVGAKYLSKYGKEFLPEIIKHLNLYEINKSSNYYEEVLNSTIVHSMKKKSFDKNDNQNNTDKKDSNAISNNIFQGNHNNNVIGVMKKRNIQETPGKNERIDNIFSLQNKNILNQSHNKSLIDIDNSAMFNSMSESKSNKKEKNEILIDLNNNSIKADKDVLDDFLKDLEKYSDEAKQLEKELNEKKNIEVFKNKANPFSNYGNNNIASIDNNINNIQKDEIIDPFEEFNDFDINNLNEYISDLPAFNNNLQNKEEDSDGDEEIENFARQVKNMNSLMNKGKDNKKRKRKDDDDDDDDEENDDDDDDEEELQAGGKKPKKSNNKSEYFKKRAIYAKINKNRQYKKNNFL